MKQDIVVPRRLSLGIKVIRYAIGVYTLFTIIITGYLLKTEYESARNRLIDSLVKIENTFYDVFASNIWEINRKHFKSTLHSLEQNENIIGLRFTHPDGEVLAEVGDVPQRSDINNETLINNQHPDLIKGKVVQLATNNKGFFDQYVELKFELWWKNPVKGEDPVFVGYGSIFSSNRILVEQVKHDFYLILVNAITKTILLWLVFYTIIHIIISKPLQLLTNEISRIDPKRPKKSQELNPILNRSDELGVLATTYNSMIDSIDFNIRTIEDLNANLEQKVIEKTKDIRSMLENMKQGILTFGIDQKIHGEYSKYLEEIFESNQIEGEFIDKFLFENCKLSSNQINMATSSLTSFMGEDEFAYECNAHLLPTEIETIIAGKEKILELSWEPIYSDNHIIEKVMVIIRDLTNIKQLQQETEKAKEELALIGEILAAGSEKVARFIKNAQDLIGENATLLKSQKNPDINHLFRNLHTIKGNSRTYKLTLIENFAHEAEVYYDQVRGGGETLAPARALNELQILSTLIDRYERIMKEKLSSTVDNGNQMMAPLIARLDQYQTQNSISEKDKVIEFDRMLFEYMNQDCQQICFMIQDEVTALATIASDLEKATPQVNFELHDIYIKKSLGNLFKNISNHLLRNSLDHGIEKPADRKLQHKPENGEITIRQYKNDQESILEFSDDGRGLNLAYLESKFKLKNISDEEIAENIFRSGVSTAEKTTNISGRGVGMDAVRSMLEQSECSIAIVFKGDRKSDGYRPFSFQIKIPQKHYIVMSS